MEPSFELFDHTADIGIRVRGKTLSDLIVPAGEALYAVIGELATTGDGEEMTFDLVGDSPELLLRDYLGELVVLFERDRVRLEGVRVSRFVEDRLIVHGKRAELDGDRCELEREVKAVTYHELSIREIAGGFEATLIVDV